MERDEIDTLRDLLTIVLTAVNLYLLIEKRREEKLKRRLRHERKRRQLRNKRR